MSIPLRPNLKDTVLLKQLGCAKVMAGLLLLNGHYLEAMRCLLHVVRITPADTHSWYLLLRWLLWLDERELVKVALRIAREATKQCEEPGFARVLEVAGLYHRLLSIYPSQATEGGSLDADPPLPYKEAWSVVCALVKMLGEWF